jgi:hypothetical protein
MSEWDLDHKECTIALLEVFHGLRQAVRYRPCVTAHKQRGRHPPHTLHERQQVSACKLVADGAGWDVRDVWLWFRFIQLLNNP